MRTHNRAARCGFTIVELLTVISVIIILIAMIVPGINYTKKIARELKIKAQIKGLSEGIEAFYGDYEFYPPSNLTGSRSQKELTCGSMKFAEALVGLDLHGYDPQSTFDVETTVNDPRAYVGQASLDRRKEMFITPSQDMVAVDVNSLGTFYSDWGDLYDSPPQGYKVGRLLCDAMKVREVPGAGGTTMVAGTPFVYFKADTGSRLFDKTQNKGNIYNYEDNMDLFKLMPLSEETDKNGNLIPHAWSPNIAGNAGRTAFYNAITNPAITTEPRPYNTNGFLIISAGIDGVYGTKDDITNYKR